MDFTDLGLSDLVLDTQIDVEFEENITYRYTVESKVSAGRNVRRKQRRDAWQLERVLGKNPFGDVSLYKCITSEGPAELQAVKRIRKAIASDDNASCFDELDAVAKFSQKKYEGLFVEFLGWYESNDSWFIAMEYLEYGSLDSHLKCPLPEKEAREITLQIAEGLEVLHENGFPHGSLKPASIFVFRKSPDWWVKIGDLVCFGNTLDNAGLKSEMKIPGFLPPEIVLSDPEFSCTEMVDVWALGFIAFYMVYHCSPSFTSSSTALQSYVQGEPFKMPSSIFRITQIDENCHDFIKRLMAPQPANRLSAKEATQHVWLRPTKFPRSRFEGFKIAERGIPAAIEPEKKHPQTPRPTSKETIDRSTEEVNEESDISSECSGWHTADDGSEVDNEPNSETGTTPFFEGTDHAHCDTIFEKYKNRPHGFFLVSPYDQGLQFFRGDELKESELQAIHDEGVNLCSQKTEWERAEIMLKTAAETRRNLFGLEHQYTHDSYQRLGVLYYEMGKLSQAEEIFRLIIDPQTMADAWGLQSKMKSAYWLGVLVMRGGRYEKGQAILKSVIKMQESTLGRHHPDTMLSVSETNWLPPHYAKMLEDTLEMKSTIDRVSKGKPFQYLYNGIKLISYPHDDTLSRVVFLDREDLQVQFTIPEKYYYTAATLGMILHAQRNFEQARAYIINAVNGLYGVRQEPDTRFLDVLYLHGRNELEHGQRYDIAEDIFRELIDELITRMCDTRTTLHLFNELASALVAQKKWTDARTVLGQASDIRATRLIPLSQASIFCDETKAMFHLLFARVLHMMDQVEEAERHCLTAVELASKYCINDICRMKYPACLQLGKTLFHQRKYVESEDAFLKAKNAWDGIKIQDLSEGSFWLAKTMCEQEKYEEAEHLFHFALDERSIRLGKDALDTVESAYWLGYTHYHTKKYAEAEARLYQALIGWKTTPGDSDSCIRASLDFYAKSLQAQRKDELAQKACIELLTLDTLNLGREREQTLKTMTRLAVLLESHGKVAEAHVLFTEVWDRTKYWGKESLFHVEAAGNMYRTRSQFLKELSPGIA